MITDQALKTEERPIDQEADFLKINAIDHIEFWVGNAKQSVFYWKQWGFKPIAYCGLETGNRRYASYVLEQGNIRFVLSTAYSPHSEMAAHLAARRWREDHRPGSGRRGKRYRETTPRGAKGLQAPIEPR